MNRPEVIRRGIIDRALEGGPGLALLILAAFLLLVWGFLAVRHRRIFPCLGVTTIILAVIGYLVYDWHHLSLNCSMRDAQTVRDDCIRLLLLRKETFKDNDSMTLHLRGSDIPASLTRTGAELVKVDRRHVYICLHTNWNGGAWGFLYDSNPSPPDLTRQKYI